MASELSLTTSVTFQFILAQSTYPYLARSYNDTPNLRLVRQTLSLPIQATCSSCGRPHKFQLPISDLNHGSDNGKWYIKTDGSLVPSLAEVDALDAGQKYFHFHGIEIKSRKFDSTHQETTLDDNSPSHIHTVSMKTEIAAVLQQLQSRLGKLYLGSQAWLFPSVNCDINVHFFNGSKDFPLTTIKKISWILLAWQRLFDGLHDTHRITDKPLFEDSLDVHLDAWLHQIKKAPGMRSVTQLLTGVKAARIIDIDSDGSITFNQQASTFDSAAVNAWIDTLTKVILRAHYAEGTFFAWQFSSEGEYRAPTYDAFRMIRDLNVKKNTIKYYRSKAKDTISQRDEDLACALESTSRQDLLGPLAMHVANTAMANSSHERVKTKILEKLRNGGYGRYMKSYVDAVEAASAPKDTQKVKRGSWILI